MFAHRLKRCRSESLEKRSECRGHIAASLPVSRDGAWAAANGHPFMVMETWMWCLRCGCHDRRRVVGLARQCRGRPRGPAYQALRQRLLGGRHPRSGALIVKSPRRLKVTDWQCWQASVGSAELRDLEGDDMKVTLPVMKSTQACTKAIGKPPTVKIEAQRSGLAQQASSAAGGHVANALGELAALEKDGLRVIWRYHSNRFPVAFLEERHWQLSSESLSHCRCFEPRCAHRAGVGLGGLCYRM